MKKALFILILILNACHQQAFKVYQGNIFATTYMVKIRTSDSNKVSDTEIKDKLLEINDIMSAFKADSELSKINRTPANQWINLSPKLSFLLKKSHEISLKTKGNFDPALGALIDLWGFGKEEITDFPTAEQVQTTLKKSTLNQIEFSSDFSKIKKNNDTVSFNVSAIAKGFAVDEIAQLLNQKDIQNYVIEIGGEIRVKGNKSHKHTGWNIAIETPVKQTKQNALILNLKDESIATSGNYKNFFIYNGEKLSHTISPKSGTPAPSDLASVSVIADDCMTADAYATAFMAMGAKQAIKHANDYGIKAIFFIQTKNGIEISISNALKKPLK